MNTEPDEYNCACPQGYSGKNCHIGEDPLLLLVTVLSRSLRLWFLCGNLEAAGEGGKSKNFKISACSVFRNVKIVCFSLRCQDTRTCLIWKHANFAANDPPRLHQPSTPVFPILALTVVRATKFPRGSSASVQQAGRVRPVPTVSRCTTYCFQSSLHHLFPLFCQRYVISFFPVKHILGDLLIKHTQFSGFLWRGALINQHFDTKPLIISSTLRV